jgi:hypothetical protein
MLSLVSFLYYFLGFLFGRMQTLLHVTVPVDVMGEGIENLTRLHAVDRIPNSLCARGLQYLLWTESDPIRLDIPFWRVKASDNIYVKS